MSLDRSYKCDGCERIMPPGAPCLTMYVEDTEVEDEAIRNRRRKRRAPVGYRDAQIDLCGDCRARDVNVSRILDRLVPPMKACAACGGVGELGTGSGDDAAVWTECPKCKGACVVPA